MWLITAFLHNHGYILRIIMRAEKSIGSKILKNLYVIRWGKIKLLLGGVCGWGSLLFYIIECLPKPDQFYVYEYQNIAQAQEASDQ